MSEPRIEFTADGHKARNPFSGADYHDPPGYEIRVGRSWIVGPTFSRVKDAEIALAMLLKLPIEWFDDGDYICSQLNELFPVEGELTKYMTEHLQW